MALFGEDFESLLPPYLTSEQKARLKEGLLQFSIDRSGQNNSPNIDYTKFTSREPSDYFKQSDIVRQIRFPLLDDDYNFSKKYTEAIILSNTCDISSENTHTLNTKQVVLAPILRLKDYIDTIIAGKEFDSKKLENFINELKLQRITNLFYISDNGGDEYIALLDRIFWFPTEELNGYLPDIDENKMFSLSMFGYYLFLLKLSFHFCRFPESLERAV